LAFKQAKRTDGGEQGLAPAYAPIAISPGFVHPFILKILILTRSRMQAVVKQAAFFFAALRLCERKKYLASLSEHDFRDLKDGQEGIASCPSFNL
jgi:hypothetical protein